MSDPIWALITAAVGFALLWGGYVALTKKRSKAVWVILGVLMVAFGLATFVVSVSDLIDTSLLRILDLSDLIRDIIETIVDKLRDAARSN